jgi:hypothetical protein
MNNQSINTARSAHKHPTIPSNTHYAYPFPKTPRFPNNNPPYHLTNSAALKLSTAITLSCPPAKLDSALAKRQIFKNYSPTIHPPIVTTSNRYLKMESVEVWVLAVLGRNHLIDPTSSLRYITIQGQAMYSSCHVVWKSSADADETRILSQV